MDLERWGLKENTPFWVVNIQVFRKSGIRKLFRYANPFQLKLKKRPEQWLKKLGRLSPALSAGEEEGQL